jgi:hypothetical protein
MLIILFSLIFKIVYDHLFPFKEGMKDIGKSIKRSISKPFNTIKKTGQKAANGIGDIFKSIQKIGKFLSGVFISIGSFLDCSAFYIGNIFSYCIIYYLLYIIGLILYCPFAFLFWISGTQEMENTIWDIMEMINDFMVDITGFDFTDYIYPYKCYKCNIKPMPKLKL